MRCNSAGFFESIGVIDCGFECQSCNRSYTRHCHHPHAHRVLRCRALHASIQFQIVLKEDRTGTKQRKNRVREHFSPCCLNSLSSLVKSAGEKLPAPRLMLLKRVEPAHISERIGIVQRGSRTSQACVIEQTIPHGHGDQQVRQSRDFPEFRAGTIAPVRSRESSS